MAPPLQTFFFFSNKEQVWKRQKDRAGEKDRDESLVWSLQTFPGAIALRKGEPLQENQNLVLCPGFGGLTHLWGHLCLQEGRGKGHAGWQPKISQVDSPIPASAGGAQKTPGTFLLHQEHDEIGQQASEGMLLVTAIRVFADTSWSGRAGTWKGEKSLSCCCKR